MTSDRKEKISVLVKKWENLKKESSELQESIDKLMAYKGEVDAKMGGKLICFFHVPEIMGYNSGPIVLTLPMMGTLQMLQTQVDDLTPEFEAVAREIKKVVKELDEEL